ncbi:MAG: HAD-IIB family hydrolase [Candidatus Thiodiazotropha sp.]|jgi:mannosyl-3-phosphoglycerate phosphatase
MMNGWLVFTDLDGTLLDHHSYDYTPALPALRSLKEQGIPVIPVSSKTYAELQIYMQWLQLDGPLVAENGAVIVYPGEAPQIAPPGYLQIRDYLIDCRANPNFDFIGFGDMSTEDIMQETGLDEDSVKLAIQRLASEPLIWQGDEAGLRHFRQKIAHKRLRLLQGGRFLHLLSDTDKGCAIKHIVTHLNKKMLVRRTIALGDSDNDRDMLLAADIPIIVRRHDGSHLQLPERPDAHVTEQPGPTGWNQAILDLLNLDSAVNR